MNKYLILLCVSNLAYMNYSWAMDPLLPPQDIPSKETSYFKKQLGRKLRIAAANGDLHRVQALIKIWKAPVNARDENGWTPLMWATKYYRRFTFTGGAQTISTDEVCKFLIKQGAEVDARANDGLTPLMRAASYGLEGICKLLIQLGAHVDAQDISGYTPLIHAVQSGSSWGVDWSSYDEGSFIVCKLLLAYGAQIDKQDARGRTPLIMAIAYGHKEKCALLIDHMIYTKKEAKAAAIALISMKRFNKVTYIAAQDRPIINLIAKQIWEQNCMKKQELIGQINAIKNQTIKQHLLGYIQSKDIIRYDVPGPAFTPRACGSPNCRDCRRKGN